MASSYSLLVIRLSSLGDLLLATPFVRQLRARFPEARLDALADERFADALRHNPHINRLIEYSRSASAQARRAQKREIAASLPNARYDVVIDLQRNARSARFRAGLGATALKVRKMRAQKLALVYLGRNYYGERITPIAERYRQTAAALGVEDDGEGLELWLPEERGSEYPPRLRRQNAGAQRNGGVCVAIAPGARHTTKRWLPERFAEAGAQTLRRLGAEGDGEIILLGLDEDQEACRAVERALGARARVRNCCGARSVYETARELDRADVLLTNDTGVAHIAAARQTPVVAVFGSTVREFGFAPYRVRSEIVETPASEVPCRPCTHIGRSKCPKTHFNCMRLATTEQVVEAAVRLVGATTGA